jgi:hypothetical protein
VCFDQVEDGIDGRVCGWRAIHAGSLGHGICVLRGSG